jgi:hypothetical protein
VTVRTELFGNGPFPVKDQPCFLRPKDSDTVIALKVATIQSSVGDVITKMLCLSVDQGA